MRTLRMVMVCIKLGRRFSPMPADNYSISSLFKIKILTICVHLRPKWDFHTIKLSPKAHDGMKINKNTEL